MLQTAGQSLKKKAAYDATELSPEHLEGFRQSQKLAYACVEHVESELREGMTEIEAAARMSVYFKDHGVTEYFHQPFVWFGERTAFSHIRHQLEVHKFFPTKLKLTPDTAVILDVAPILNGYASDIGYACAFGKPEHHSQMLADLEPYRALVLQGVRAKKTMSDIYRDVDALIARQGYENRHAAYPYRVLAHRVTHVDPSALNRVRIGGFGVPALAYLTGRMADTFRGKAHHSPLWNASKACDRVCDPGLWAIEPHIGFRGVGVKWEELLVVTENDAYWLDDDLPHVRRWRKH